ncbi:hypothetical protein WN71_011520 [Streptomyces mangrovisoli]|uniref:Membrane-bound hydrophilic protein n=2 Tax=Streptomyces mangrovisoli TaxID=1428628 RepID=A0A1J4P2I9_9ACTN|nr:hypothetical protein WN71_011520 [Streptomyces mangrovisoli]
MPASKAIATVAMPTAVLMGLGFTATWAAADSSPSASNSQKAEEYKDCVAALDDSSASPSASDSASPSPSASASESTDTQSADTKSSDAKSGGSDSSSSSDSGSDDQATPSPSATSSSGGSSSSDDTATASPSASASSGNVLDTIGDAIGDLLTGGKDTSTASASASATPSATATGDSSSSDSAASSGDSSGSDTVKDTVDKATEAASDTAKDAGDTATEAASDAVKAAEDAATSTASPSPSASESTDTSDCAVATDDESGVDNKTPVADDPWYLSASSLTLKGADYQGVVEVKTASGATKKVLKYVISGGTDIGDMHQTVNDKQSGKTYHVQAGKGSTSTITGGDTVMYTESISGNLFGLVPVTFTPDNPPPLNIPLIYFTNVKVTQAAQFGGTLHVPGMHVYTSDS